MMDAVRYLMQDAGVTKPSGTDVVAALVAAEKQAKKEKRRYAYEQLVGTWRLGFVSGTQTVKAVSPGAKSIKRPGRGRFLPRWIEVSITYGAPEALLVPALRPEMVRSEVGNEEIPANDDLGAVVNRVALGGAMIQLSGPTRYWPNTNSLGFDFVYLQGSVGAFTLYSAPVRGGVESAKTFADQSLKTQAFFTFFQVEPTYLAARGKGGGLALWTRVNAS